MTIIYAEKPKFSNVKKHFTDAGVDLSTKNKITLQPWQTYKIETGVSIKFDDHEYGLVAGRSSLNSKGLLVLNGIVDEGYRGQIYVTMTNLNDEPVTFEEGERIAQIITMNYKDVEYNIGKAPEGTTRGIKGFGSSGR